MKPMEQKKKALDLLGAHHASHTLSESLLIFYWMTSSGDEDQTYHLERAEERLKETAEIMGYNLTKKGEQS